jgi:hypothetical protein
MKGKKRLKNGEGRMDDLKQNREMMRECLGVKAAGGTVQGAR